jgi:ABC-type uncharacterized transport system permease subunit
MLLKPFKEKLQVQVVSSDLQGVPSVIIRGLGTALGGRTPLYIVDGCLRISIILIPMILLHTKFLKMLRLCYLWTRAANGVIIITTKR